MNRPAKRPSFMIWLARRRGLMLRGLAAWTVGLFVLFGMQNQSFDTRLRLRGNQAFENDVILIQLKVSDLAATYRLKTNDLVPLKEISDITDSFYWNKTLWNGLLKKILAQNPKKVGVSLFFSENLGPLRLTPEEKSVFFDPRLVWASNSTLTDRSSFPLFANDLRNNIGNYELLRDDDGVIRRFTREASTVPHLIERVTGVWLPLKSNRYVNYRGLPNSQFTMISLTDLMDDRIPNDTLKGKLVIIGSEAASSSQFLTPLGPSSRQEILAHIADNVLQQRWINRIATPWYAAGLFLLMVFSVLILNNLPQKVSFFLLATTMIMIGALSAWIFDRFYLWTPVIAPLIQTLVLWVIFLGYQATKIERHNWQLQQEQKYLFELEQLKSNFVSLISHDLKTPIAKIQAVSDRLIANPQAGAVLGDLKSIKNSSEELLRYIQSILKILRIESREFKINVEVADINELIQSAIEQLRPLAADKDIQIDDILEPLFTIEIDTTLIREVIVNLIENSIKYTPPGGRIQVLSTEVDEYVKVSIIDSGEGIPPEELTNVWGKFVRGKDQDLKTKGSGLGLYLVKYFVELHDGQVEITSQVGKGTQVSFRLPVEAKG